MTDGPAQVTRKEDALLSWFAGLGLPMSEKPMRLGGFHYSNFSAAFSTIDGRQCTSHGRSQDRRLAAIKCVAEFMERKFMKEFFQSAGAQTSARSVRLLVDHLEQGLEESVLLPPSGLRSSNGWAVHQDSGKADQGALMEALERHLLLKSFHQFGWQGFQLVEAVESSEMKLAFLTSRFKSSGYIGGLVVAQSPLYPGISLGYCAGKADQVGEARFWESALFEAIDKILNLGGQSVKLDDSQAGQGCWITAEIKHYLETPFDMNLFARNASAPAIDDGAYSGYLKSFDLAQAWGLDFPLHAAFAWGGDFIPLYHRSKVTGAARDYFLGILARNHLPPETPERHPIL